MKKTPWRKGESNLFNGVYSLKTTFFNVQHGDAIFINYGDRGLVRDFGSLSPNAQFFVYRLATVLVKASKRYPNYPLEAMLTHPHVDHYSGFEYLHSTFDAPKIFNISYIPWLDFTTLRTLHAVYLRLGLLHLYIFPQKTKINQKIKDWIKMAPLMADLSKYLLGVGENTRLPHNNYTEQILWPPQCPNVPPNYCHNCCYCCHCCDHYDFILNKILNKEQRNLFEEAYNQLFYMLSSIHMDGKQKNTPGKFTLVNKLLDKITPFKINNEKNDILQDFARICQWRMLRDIDDHSIVFKIDDEAVFFSDLHSGSIGKIAQKHLNGKQFKLMKSAHHGSRFGAKMPQSNCKAQKIVHSCGPSPYRYKGPDVKYSQLLTTHNPAADIICTDWNYNSSIWKLPSCGYNIVAPKKIITL